MTAMRTADADAPHAVPNRLRTGFSLPELLIVVAIIALVIGLVIPTIGALRARARTMQCMTNQRSIAQALYAYATSNASYFPSPRTDYKGVIVSDGVDVRMAPNGSPYYGANPPPTPVAPTPLTHTWVKAIPEDTNYVVVNQFETPKAIEDGVLFPYVGTLKTYVSPDEPSNPYLSQVSSASTRVRSYSLNALLGTTRPDELPEFDDDFMSTVGPMGGVRTPLSRYNATTIGTVKSPQRMMCTLVEDDEVAYNNQGWLIYPQNPTWVDWPAGWRPDAITMTYVDGSTDTRALADPTLPAKWDQFGHRWVDSAGTDNAFDWRWFRDRLNPGVIPNSTTGFMGAN
jgi:prepilin-type N-terminal cleavage/methylation domain-containing protein